MRTALNGGDETGRTAGPSSLPRPKPLPGLARTLVVLVALAALAPMLALVAVVALGRIDPAAGVLLVFLGLLGTIAAGHAAWRAGLRVDGLAERLCAAHDVSTPRGDPVARIEAVQAHIERRLVPPTPGRDTGRLDDPVTGLPGRLTLMRRGRDEITRCRRNLQPMAVALIALSIGGPTEEARPLGRQKRALRLTAEILQQSLRAYDVVGRWEHAVFLAILPEAEIEHAVAAIERVGELLDRVGSVRADDPLLSMHGGVAVLQPDDATLAEIAERAARAMARAQSGIGPRVQAAPGARHRPSHLIAIE